MIGALKLGVPVFMIGAAAGWLSLMFVGVPLVAPSYMAQREALTKAQGAAASQATAHSHLNELNCANYLGQCWPLSSKEQTLSLPPLNRP